MKFLAADQFLPRSFVLALKTFFLSFQSTHSMRKKLVKKKKKPEVICTVCMYPVQEDLVQCEKCQGLPS
jgi:hypothetical protein